MGSIKERIKQLTPSFIWRFLQKIRRQRTLATFEKKIVKHSYAGEVFELSIQDPIADHWYNCDWPPQNEIELLRKGKLKPGANVFDVGAHQCVFAMLLARIVSPGGSVLALEAEPHSAAVGEQNRQLNHVSNLRVLHAAGAAVSGELDFGNDCVVGNNDPKSYRVRVKSYAMDELAREHGYPDVFFVDVEGFEFEVLKGSTEILKRNPDCYIEVHTGTGLEKAGGTVEDVLKFFPLDRYDLFISPRDVAPFEPFKIDSPILRKMFYLVALSKPV